MEISYITSSRIPTERAYGYAIAKLCEEWGEAGHQVELVVPDRRHGPQEDIFSYYDLEKKFSVRKLAASDFIGERVSTSRVRFTLDLLRYCLSLRRLKFESGTILYTREYVLANILPSKNLFLELHTIPSRGFLFARALKRARGIVVISGGLRDGLLRLGVASEKIHVAHDGVDLAAFSNVVPDRTIWKSVGVDPQKKIVLYTGHLYEWKGADTLAKAAANLPADVQCVFMGGVDEELERFRATYTSRNITVVPYQKRAAIPLFLVNADVLVLPNSGRQTISREHASPLKLFEYMASGRPIVASNVPSIHEILDDGSAFWFTPDDPQACTATLRNALSHEGEAREKAERARAIVSKYTWGSRAEAIAAFMGS